MPAGRPRIHDEEMVRCGYYNLPRRQIQAISRLAKRRGVSASELLRQIIERYIDKR